MKKENVIAFESFRLGKEQKTISNTLIEKLYDFLALSYHLINQEEFLQLIIKPNEPGELVVLYGRWDDIAGFCRIFEQKLRIDDKLVTVYLACVQFNQKYNPYPTSASMGLAQGISHKLEHPEEEIVYVALANTPFSYEVFNQMIKSLYPTPGRQVPFQVLKTIEALKKYNGWYTTGNHPMVISSILVPIRSYNPDFQYDNSALCDFYLSINPDYRQGNALLTYIPLNLANINYGLNAPSTTSYTNKPPHHLYPEPTYLGDGRIGVHLTK
ncbi:MAG: hypothetical protein H0U75_01970 [Legionella sp.]|nr:hypothetical protein [Legionella sp.]